ncbi:MAG: Lipoprotein-releasing system ATP-binding protein LolD [Myxococcota bacterium]|nr:Lipoprotein-releasing system ATP-binding protein LolD [Myxococcota bacterium]
MGELAALRGLNKSFWLNGREVPVLRGVNLSIAAGEIVSLTGHSGSGKSTLLAILGTLDSPTSGEVVVDGRPISQIPRKELAPFRNRTIGYVFQFHLLLPEFTALENVMMPALISGQNRSAAKNRAADLLAAVGLAGRIHHKPGELSGGEQQRVAVARALVMEPRLLLADEPTGNLDEDTALQVHELLLDLNRRSGAALVFATHSRKLADLAPRRLCIAGGNVQDLEPAPA